MSRDDSPIRVSPKSLRELYRIALGVQFRMSGIGGQAITNYTCLRCEDEFAHGNTATPNFCPDCTRSLIMEFKNEPRR